MLPEDFLNRMEKMLGEEYPQFLESFERERHCGLRLNALKIGAEGSSAASRYGAGDIVGDRGFAHLTPVPWAENGYYYEADDQPGKHPFHEAGLYYIQEPSAMAPAGLLEVQPGQRVLDLCAAPGGKSTQLAAGLQGKGFLLCNEINSARARVLSGNIERMGITNACVTNETPARLAELFPGYFHRVLVDAPCSGEGMFRKNEAACEEWSPENVRLCAARQDEILDCAAEMLCPGGRLVYSTCTFAPEENEGSVSRFLSRHPDFALCPIEKKKYGWEGCDGNPAYIENPAEGLENTLRLAPHRIKGEGHFAAVLQKQGSLPERLPGSGPGSAQRPVPEKELEEFEAFCRENLQIPEAGQRAVWKPGAGSCGYVRFGDNLYLTPEGMPGLKGVRVLRPGLHLGELKKNRFEPAHALALALAPGQARHVWNLDSNSPEVRAYLNGQSFPAEGEKGWYLICVDGFSLGWGKLAGNMMKNHYPKGLRINYQAGTESGKCSEDGNNF